MSGAAREARRLATREDGHAVPRQRGSCYFDVSDVEALRQEFLDGGATPGAIEPREYGGKRFRLFFLKEDYDNYCFCFGEPA